MNKLIEMKEKESYALCEIRYGSMGKGKQGDKNSLNKPSKGVIAVSGPGFSKKSNNEFEEAVEWQKFNLIYPQIKELMTYLNNFDMIHLYNLIF